MRKQLQCSRAFINVSSFHEGLFKRKRHFSWYFKMREKTHRIPSVDKNVFEENRTINRFK